MVCVCLRLGLYGSGSHCSNVYHKKLVTNLVYADPSISTGFKGKRQEASSRVVIPARRRFFPEVTHFSMFESLKKRRNEIGPAAGSYLFVIWYLQSCPPQGVYLGTRKG